MNTDCDAFINGRTFNWSRTSNKSRIMDALKLNSDLLGPMCYSRVEFQKSYILITAAAINAIAFLLFISITGSIISYLYQMSLSSRHLLLIISLLTSAFRCKL